MRIQTLAGWLTVVWLAAPVPDASAQSRERVRATVVPDEIMCRSCEIVIDSQVVLRARPGDPDGLPTQVRQDSNGRYWVFRRDQLPTLFSAKGERLQVIGRRGRGPGEYVEAYDMLSVVGDSVVVLDGNGRRATVLDPALRPTRFVQLPFEIHGAAVVAWPDTVVGSGIVQTASEFGWPLHRVSFRPQTAVVGKSFGPGDGDMPPDGSMRSWHWVAPTSEGTIWTAWAYAFDLTEWRTDGSIQRALVRRPTWFTEVSSVGLGNPTTPPPPLIASIQQDSGGLLWVVARVPAATWRNAWPNLAPGTREVLGRQLARELLYSTIIEVIDPATARVVARRSVDRYAVAGLPARRVAYYGVDERTGAETLSVAQLSLRR